MIKCYIHADSLILSVRQVFTYVLLLVSVRPFWSLIETTFNASIVRALLVSYDIVPTFILMAHTLFPLY